MSKRDYYEVLNISREATSSEIKKAYRTLAMKYHPDRNPGDKEAEELFKEASEAYSVLGNEEKRSVYDKYGFDAVNGAGSSYSDGGFFSDSIFSDFEDLLGGLFGGHFGGRRSRGSNVNRARRGDDLGVETQITLKEAFLGVEKNIKVEQEQTCDVCGGNGAKKGTEPQVCPDCQGSGTIRHRQGFFSIASTCNRCQGSGKIVSDPCENCHGKGRVRAVKEIKVNIPAGVDSGNRLRVSSAGDDGYNGGPSGDLYLSIIVKEEENFIREGNNLVYLQKISFSQAALGDTIKISTFEDEEKIKIPSETQWGDEVKFRSKGFKNIGSWGRGDLIVRFHVVTPKVNSGNKHIFKELKEQEAGILKEKRRFFA